MLRKFAADHMICVEMEELLWTPGLRSLNCIAIYCETFKARSFHVLFRSEDVSSHVSHCSLFEGILKCD